MAKIAGYRLTWEVDQGDAWMNAVSPKEEKSIAHKECAWNYEALLPSSDVTDLQPIGYEEAEQEGHVCGYCEQPLTATQYYAFQLLPVNQMRVKEVTADHTTE